MTLLLPESLQAHVCTLSFLLVLSPLPLYCPLLSSSSPSHTQTHTHTPVFWFEAPFCSSQRPPFCSCFSLHARPVALPAPTFPRAALFCGSLLISLQFSFVGLFFSISDLPSSFAWPLVFSSVNVWITELFLEKKIIIKEKRKKLHSISFSHVVMDWTLAQKPALSHPVLTRFYLKQKRCGTGSPHASISKYVAWPKLPNKGVNCFPDLCTTNALVSLSLHCC